MGREAVSFNIATAVARRGEKGPGRLCSRDEHCPVARVCGLAPGMPFFCPITSFGSAGPTDPFGARQCTTILIVQRVVLSFRL